MNVRFFQAWACFLAALRTLWRGRFVFESNWSDRADWSGDDSQYSRNAWGNWWPGGSCNRGADRGGWTHCEHVSRLWANLRSRFAGRRQGRVIPTAESFGVSICAGPLRESASGRAEQRGHDVRGAASSVLRSVAWSCWATVYLRAIGAWWYGALVSEGWAHGMRLVHSLSRSDCKRSSRSSGPSFTNWKCRCFWCRFRSFFTQSWIAFRIAFTWGFDLRSCSFDGGRLKQSFLFSLALFSAVFRWLRIFRVRALKPLLYLPLQFVQGLFCFADVIHHAADQRPQSFRLRICNKFLEISRNIRDCAAMAVNVKVVHAFDLALELITASTLGGTGTFLRAAFQSGTERRLLCF